MSWDVVLETDLLFKNYVWNYGNELGDKYLIAILLLKDVLIYFKASALWITNLGLDPVTLTSR